MRFLHQTIWNDNIKKHLADDRKRLLLEPIVSVSVTKPENVKCLLLQATQNLSLSLSSQVYSKVHRVGWSLRRFEHRRCRNASTTTSSRFLMFISLISCSSNISANLELCVAQITLWTQNFFEPALIVKSVNIFDSHHKPVTAVPNYPFALIVKSCRFGGRCSFSLLLRLKRHFQDVRAWRQRWSFCRLD